MYCVVRTHSQTDRQTLRKVFSRNLQCYNDAVAMKRYFKRTEKNKQYVYFIVEVPEADLWNAQ